MNHDNPVPERHECDVLLAFKALYCAANITQPRRAFAAWRNRRANIRPVDEAALVRTP